MQLNSQCLRYIVTLFIFSLAACQTEEAKPSVEINDELLPYFERFESEATSRGIEAPVTTLVSGKLTDIDGDVVGQCEHYTNSPNTVLIDQQYWQNATDLEKEYLLFHELGHCYLERSHLDSKDASGKCLSIMQSGQGNCRMNYNSSTRTAYLDELFD